MIAWVAHINIILSVSTNVAQATLTPNLTLIVADRSDQVKFTVQHLDAHKRLVEDINPALPINVDRVRIMELDLVDLFNWLDKNIAAVEHLDSVVPAFGHVDEAVNGRGWWLELLFIFNMNS